MSDFINSPSRITENTISLGVSKVNNPFLKTFLLSVLAGVFIGLGAVFYTLVKSDITYSFATKQIFGGFVFCIGLILVVVAGAELFTGNTLIIMAFADKKVTVKQLLKNWLIVFLGNSVGAISLAVLIFISGHLEMNGGSIGKMYLKMAEGKASLSFEVAFVKGILCNLLVCLAIWLAAAGKTVTDKVMGIIFPITLFVAAGFEHSIANLFIIPLGLLVKNFNTVCIETTNLSLLGMFNNILPVALGNIVGGGFFVGLVYYLIYSKRS